jgi:hypothetical protein
MSGLYLGALVMGLTTWVMLPFLLFEVYDAQKNGKKVEVEIVSSYIYHRGKNCSLRLSFIIPNGQQVTIGDALPGDIATCSRNETIAGRYRAGEKYNFVVVDDQYYIAQGKYWWSLTIALVGLMPYIYLIYSIRKAKNSCE